MQNAASYEHPDRLAETLLADSDAMTLMHEQFQVSVFHQPMFLRVGFSVFDLRASSGQLDNHRMAVKSTKLSDKTGLKCFNLEFEVNTIQAENAARLCSAVLLPAHCLHSAEFPTR